MNELNYKNDFKKTDNIFEDLKVILVSLNECKKIKGYLWIQINSLKPDFSTKEKTKKIIWFLYTLLVLFSIINAPGGFDLFFGIVTGIFLSPLPLIILGILKFISIIRDKTFKYSEKETLNIKTMKENIGIIEEIEQYQQSNLDILNYPKKYRSILDIANVVEYYNNQRVDTLKEALNLLESDKKHEELMEAQHNMAITLDNLDSKMNSMSSDVRKTKRYSAIGATFSILGVIANSGSNYDY